MSAPNGDRPAEPWAPTLLSEENLDRLSASLDALRLLGQAGRATEQGERTFGRFRLRQVLGQGKFGIVFLADDPQSGRQVALKLPQPEVLVDPVLGERFHRDAEAAGTLDHPGIVPILEAGSVGAAPYLVMPHVPGPTLAAWLRQHTPPVPVADAVNLALALAEAVQYAHERGVLHCDLKPANILLSPRNPGPADDLDAYRPRITDFGLARLLYRDPQETRTQLTAGTPPYMAPEQALGTRRDLTARCDVHALAAVLYELLTGQPPYAAPGGGEAVRDLLDPQAQPAPPRQVRPEVPRDLEAIALKGLEKAPEARYASAGGLADDLRRFRQGRPTRARPVGLWGRAVRWTRRRPVVAALIVSCVGMAGLAGGLGGRLIYRDVQHRHELALAGQAAELHQFHARLERVRKRRAERPTGWADDNLADLRHLAAHPAAADLQAELCSEAAEALAAPRLRLLRELAPGTNAYVCAFSPDGRTVALGERYPVLPSNELRVWLVSAATGRVAGELRYPVDLDWEKRHGDTRAGGARSLLYSPDGRWLVLGTRAGRLVRWPLGEREPRATVWEAQPRGDDPVPDEVRSLLFSEDGAVLLAGSVGQVISRWSVREGWSPAGRVEGLLPIGTPTAREATRAWVRKDEHVLFRLDLRTGAARGEIAAPGLRAFCATRGGEALVGSLFDQGVDGWQMQAAYPGLRRPLIRPTSSRQDEEVKDLAFTPDGRFLLASAEGRALELWDAARGKRVATARLGGGSARLAVSPVGGLVAVCVQDRTLLFEVAPGAAHRAAVVEGGEVGAFALSADGRRLATFLTPGVPRPGSAPIAWHSSLTLYGRGAGGFTRDQELRVPTNDLPDRHVALSPQRGGPLLAFQSNQGGAPAIQALAGQWVRAGRLNDLRFAPDGALWAAEGATLTRWSGQGAEKQVVHTASQEDARAGHVLSVVAPTAAGTFAGRQDGRLMRFGAPHRLEATWGVFPAQWVSSVATSADGTEALVGGSLGAVARVAVGSGQVTPLDESRHRDAVSFAGILPDGTAITASADHTICFRDRHDRLLLTLREGGPVAQAALGPGGELFTRVKGEWGVRAWDLPALHAGLRSLGLSPGWSVSQGTAPALPPGPRRGLVAEHFDDGSFDWLAHRRNDEQVDFAWGNQPPSPWLGAGSHSARWTGYLRAPEAGRWEVRLDTNRRATAWLDGQPVGRAAREADLSAPVSFRLDHVKGKAGRCRLLWRRAGSKGPFAPVPASAFFPDRDAALGGR